MNDTEKLFTAMVKKYLNGSGERIVPEGGAADWAELFTLAAAHKIIPWIYSAAVSEPDFKALPREVREKYRLFTMGAIAAQTMMYEKFKSIYSELRESGIHIAALKGLLCDTLYPYRDYRTTSDCDALIPPEELERCGELLKEKGLYRVDEKDDEMTFSAPGGFRLEVHTTLFSKEHTRLAEMEKWFSDWQTTGITEEIDGVKIFTFSHTDHLLYLVAHAFSHFVSGGFGIRQLCDITLYSRRWDEEIDWSLVMSRLKQAGADIFFLSLINAARSELGVRPGDRLYAVFGSTDLPEYNDLLSDLIDAGAFGKSTDERQHSANMTLGALDGGKLSPAAATLFPSLDYMKRSYAFLRRFPFLLPVAWLMRIFNYLFSNIKKKKSAQAPTDSIKYGSERIALLKKYGIIDAQPAKSRKNSG